jgi:hypothetical protein
MYISTANSTVNYSRVIVFEHQVFWVFIVLPRSPEWWTLPLSFHRKKLSKRPRSLWSNLSLAPQLWNKVCVPMLHTWGSCLQTRAALIALLGTLKFQCLLQRCPSFPVALGTCVLIFSHLCCFCHHLCFGPHD